MPILKLAAGVAHGVVQSVGLVTLTLRTQAPLVAVMITFVPTGMPTIVFPLREMVPVPNAGEVVITAPALALNATLYVPVLLQTP